MTATRSLSASLQHLNRVLLADDVSALPDAELVGRFVERRDEAAFATLVRRYGLLVFGVCRRVLRHEQDAEDAFQATFLVFARGAARVQRAGAVGNWLYGVAHNVARKARVARHRREAKEQAAAAARPAAVPPHEPNPLADVLDAELGRLPDKYRAAIVLCDLMGLTGQQAAAEVGCPAKTLGTRLARGRALLARRLARCGVALPAAGLAAVLSPPAQAADPRLLAATARMAVDCTTGSAAPAAVAALTRGVSNVMTYASIKYAALACGLLAAGAVATRPLVNHLHAGHGRAPAGGRAAEAAPPSPPADFFDRWHRFFIELLHPGMTTAAVSADDKKEEKPKPLAGNWVKKDGELKIEFGETELRVYPHGDGKAIVVVCRYTFGKDGAVKAKVTGFEGTEEAKKILSEKLPVGSEFGFTWKAAKGAATLDEVKGDKAEFLKSHLEGGFEEKK